MDNEEETIQISLGDMTLLVRADVYNYSNPNTICYAYRVLTVDENLYHTGTTLYHDKNSALGRGATVAVGFLLGTSL